MPGYICNSAYIIKLLPDLTSAFAGLQDRARSEVLMVAPVWRVAG
jgi:hypothetical protein